MINGIINSILWGTTGGGGDIPLSPPIVYKDASDGLDSYNLGTWVYLPEGHAELTDKKWPVLIMEHGTGGRGDGSSTDLDLLLTDAAPTLTSEIGYNAGAPKVGSPWLSGGSNPYKDMIVVSPQTDATMDRGPTGIFIRDILADADLRIDPDRVYITGFSLGFIGGIRYFLNTEADYNRVAGDRPPIAGAYLIAGNSWNSSFATLSVDRGLYFKSWCGENDPSYRSSSEQPVTNINAVRSSYTEFEEVPGVAHTSAAWGPQYQDYTSDGMYGRIMTNALRVVPSKSTGGTWPVMGFTSPVTLPGGVDLLTDDIKVMLVTSAHTPGSDTYISTVDDNELVGTGYTAGGVSLTGKSLVGDDFDADDVNWSNTVFSALRYIYLYNNTGDPTTSEVIGYIDLGHDRTTDGVDFIIQWYTTGILTKT